MLDAFKDLGFKYATQAGITVSKNDIVVPPDKEEILAELRDAGRRDPGAVRHGPDPQGERHDLVVEQWTAATEEVGQAMEDNLDELNPIFMMANSGARGSFKQIRQLAACVV